MSVELYANASFGHGGKQGIFRVTGGTGEKKEFVFKKDAIDTKTGTRQERSEAAVDYPGLFELCNVIGKKDKVESSFVVVCEVSEGELQEFSCENGEARKIAKLMEEGKGFSDVVGADAEGWDFVGKRASASRGGSTPEAKKAIEAAAATAFEAFKSLPESSMKKAFSALRKLVADASKPAADSSEPPAEGTEGSPVAFE